MFRSEGLCGREGGGAVLRVYFLSDRRSGPASCAKRSENEQGREMAHKNVRVFSKKIKKSGPLIMGDRV